MAREDFAHRLVALEEEIAAFGARAEAAARNAGAPAGGDAMTALYVAEARAHARALVRVARLEAAAALAPSKDDLAPWTNARVGDDRRRGQGKEEEEEADPERGATVEASTPAAATAVENARRWRPSRRRRSERATTTGSSSHPPPSDRRPRRTPSRRRRRRRRRGAVGTGAPADHPALADAPNGRENGVPSPDQPAQAPPLCRRRSSVRELGVSTGGRGAPGRTLARPPTRRE